MFGFFRRKARKKACEPVVYARADHCISRKNIDPDALKVLYRLNKLGYIAYLVGGGVRDLLLGRTPKDFDVATDARPNDVKRAFRNCYLIGRRFRLAQVRFGRKIIETATFRQESQSVGDIMRHATEGPMEDNTFGTPESDALRRDFTVNGLFYNIKDFSVIDWVGGLEDLKKRLIRSIGDPEIRFREDPVRMMRAIKFAARLDFSIEKNTERAMRELHAFILSASVPRVCEEVFRLFSYGRSEAAFKMMWRFGLLGDLLPELSEFIGGDGGENSSVWRYLAVLDRFELALREKGEEAPNGIRVAALYYAMAKSQPGRTREIVGAMLRTLKIPKATYFMAILMIDSVRRLSNPPLKGRSRFVHNRNFVDALDFNRIVVRAEGRDEDAIGQWADLYRETVLREGDREADETQQTQEEVQK